MRTVSVYWTRLSFLTRSLSILFVANGVVVSILLFLLTGDFKDTTLAYAGRYELFHESGFKHASEDSWKPMIVACEQLHESPEVPVYSTVFFDKHIKFQYPPSSLLMIELITRIPGVRRLNPVHVLNNLSWFWVFLIGICTSRLLLDSCRGRLKGGELLPASKADTLALYAVVLLITITFYPIARSFVLGQLQTTVTLLGTGSLLAWQHERKKTAGFLIGLACLSKPHYGLLLLWGAIRRQWGMLMVGLITAAGFVGIAIAMYGFHHYADYASVLSFLSRHGEAFYPNQSVNGLMNRLLFNGSNLQWAADSFPPFNLTVYCSTLVSTFVIIGMALIWRCRDAEGVGTTEFAIMMLSTTIAAPIAWEHHYGILLPTFAVLASILLSTHIVERWIVACTLIVFCLASQNLGVANRLADTHLNVLQSYLFLAGIGTLCLLYRASKGESERSQRLYPQAPSGA